MRIVRDVAEAAIEELLDHREGEVFVLVREGSLPRMQRMIERWDTDRVVPVVGDLGSDGAWRALGGGAAYDGGTLYVASGMAEIMALDPAVEEAAKSLGASYTRTSSPAPASVRRFLPRRRWLWPIRWFAASRMLLTLR